MEVKSTVTEGVTVLTPTGRVDTSTAKAFETSVMDAINASKKIAIKFGSRLD